jgi:hypothetical protein
MVMIEALPFSQVYEPWTSISAVAIDFRPSPVLEWEAIDLTNLDGNPAASSEIIFLIALLRTRCGRRLSCGVRGFSNSLFPTVLDELFTQIIGFTQAFWGCLWEPWERGDSSCSSDAEFPELLNSTAPI